MVCKVQQKAIDWVDTRMHAFPQTVHVRVYSSPGSPYSLSVNIQLMRICVSLFN